MGIYGMGRMWGREGGRGEHGQGRGDTRLGCVCLKSLYCSGSEQHIPSL